VGWTGFLELLIHYKKNGQPGDEQRRGQFCYLVSNEPRTDSINAGGGDPPIPLLLLFPPGLLVDLFLPRPPPRPPGCGGGADMFFFLCLFVAAVLCTFPVDACF
jgi:hypothetical protein